MPRRASSPDSVAMLGASSSSSSSSSSSDASAGKYKQGVANGVTSKYRGVTRAGKNRYKARICYAGEKKPVAVPRNT